MTLMEELKRHMEEMYLGKKIKGTTIPHDPNRKPEEKAFVVQHLEMGLDHDRFSLEMWDRRPVGVAEDHVTIWEDKDGDHVLADVGENDPLPEVLA